MAIARYVVVLGLAQLLTACGGDVVPTTTTATLAHFQGDGVAFDYPANWNSATFVVFSSFSYLIVYLSTEPLADPCQRAANSVSCGTPLGSLPENGVLVDWSGRSFIGWSFDPNAGIPIEVGGRPATLESAAVDESCRGIQGELELVATIPRPEAAYNWTEVRACARGPELTTTRAQIEAMLASVVWTP